MSFEQRKKELEEKLLEATDFLEKMELEDLITDLEIEYGIREANSYDFENFSCIGCGS